MENIHERCRIAPGLELIFKNVFIITLPVVFFFERKNIRSLVFIFSNFVLYVCALLT